ncbi:MAG TPA: hypothetical protein VIT45_05910 [Allosphingosinicella sp.]
MTQQGSRFEAMQGSAADVAELRQVLALVSEMAGRPLPSSMLDEDARIAAAYADSTPIVQRCFDRLAAETTARATAGIKALIALRDSKRPTRGAAARLADSLGGSLSRLGAMLSA